MEAFLIKIDQLRNYLRKDGITGMDSINHCVAFYTMRILDTKLCEKLDIPVKFAFDNFNKDDDGNELDENKLYAKFYMDNSKDCFIWYLVKKLNYTPIPMEQFKVRTAEYFAKLFSILATINPKELHVNYDVVGMIYEMHLASGASGKGMRDLGQYFTDRKVIKYMVDLCKPKVLNGKIETILDPSMGTGGFLTMATKYLNDNNPGIDWKVNQNNIYGFDISSGVQSLARFNLMIEKLNLKSLLSVGQILFLRLAELHLF
jgi:type I restriction-modification system DNA methylase subunit